jgi:hypothetical protein
VPGLASHHMQANAPDSRDALTEEVKSLREALASTEERARLAEYKIQGEALQESPGGSPSQHAELGRAHLVQAAKLCFSQASQDCGSARTFLCFAAHPASPCRSQACASLLRFTGADRPDGFALRRRTSNIDASFSRQARGGLDEEVRCSLLQGALMPQARNYRCKRDCPPQARVAERTTRAIVAAARGPR